MVVTLLLTKRQEGIYITSKQLVLLSYFVAFRSSITLFFYTLRTPYYNNTTSILYIMRQNINKNAYNGKQ